MEGRSEFTSISKPEIFFFFFVPLSVPIQAICSSNLFPLSQASINSHCSHYMPQHCFYVFINGYLACSCEISDFQDRASFSCMNWSAAIKGTSNHSLVNSTLVCKLDNRLMPNNCQAHILSNILPHNVFPLFQDPRPKTMVKLASTERSALLI